MRKKRVTSALQDKLDFCQYVECLFAVGDNQYNCELMATLVEIVGFDNAVKVCIALGGETVKIPRLVEIAANVRRVRGAQLCLNGVISKRQASDDYGLYPEIADSVINQMRELAKSKESVYREYQDKELEFLSKTLSPLLEEVQDRFVVPNVDDDGTEDEDDPDGDENPGDEETYNHPE